MFAAAVHSCTLTLTFLLGSSSQPMQLHFTSLGGRTEEHLRKNQGFPNWRVDLSAKHYSEVSWCVRRHASCPGAPAELCARVVAAQVFPKDDVVYLTAEADETLSTFRPGDVYIIGGIVDHNRLKATRRPPPWHSLPGLTAPPP